MFLLELFSFIDDLHNLFGREGRKAWPGCLCIMGGTILGIATLYHLST